jgi:hypothetical protein
MSAVSITSVVGRTCSALYTFAASSSAFLTLIHVARGSSLSLGSASCVGSPDSQGRSAPSGSTVCGV